MESIDEKFLARIESLGDNCELGFVMRNLKYEKGSLFRWSITPIDKLIGFMENPDQPLYNESDLAPYSPGMVLDKQTGFSFHSKMKSEKNQDGVLAYSVSEPERIEIHEKEKSKIEYLRSGFKSRLNSKHGSVYLIKANKGIEYSEVEKLVAILEHYSHNHVLVEVRADAASQDQTVKCKRGNHFYASISRFAPYIAANDVLYEQWNEVLKSIQTSSEINSRIGSI